MSKEQIMYNQIKCIIINLWSKRLDVLDLWLLACGHVVFKYQTTNCHLIGWLNDKTCRFVPQASFSKFHPGEALLFSCLLWHIVLPTPSLVSNHNPRAHPCSIVATIWKSVATILHWINNSCHLCLRALTHMIVMWKWHIGPLQLSSV